MAASYDQRRRTTRARGTTATCALATGARTTAAPTVAPPVATQPARTTPRAQTTALASIVDKAMRPPTSDRETIKCFISLLLGFRLTFMTLGSLRRYCP